MTQGAQLARVMCERGLVTTVRRAPLASSNDELRFAMAKRGLPRPWSWTRIAEALGRNVDDVRRCCDDTFGGFTHTLKTSAPRHSPEQQVQQAVSGCNIRQTALRCIALGLNRKRDIVTLGNLASSTVDYTLKQLREAGLVVPFGNGPTAHWEVTEAGRRALRAMALENETPAHG